MLIRLLPFCRLFQLPARLRRRARRSRMATLALLLCIPALLLLPFYLIYRPPHTLIRLFAHRWPDVLWYVDVPSGKRIVALTIDDAPSGRTREILAALQANEAHATFFVIGGQVAGREHVLRELVKGRNELGNHAMHDEPARSLADEELETQVRKVEGMVSTAYEADGRELPRGKLFRPGSGLFSKRMRALVRGMGYRMVLGSVYPHDAQVPYWRVNAWHILSAVRPGAIIICHDRRKWTVPMLNRVLPELKRRGYEVVTVSQLLAEKQVR